MADYYSILGVSFYASSEEIKRNYKRLALRYHPDRNPDNPAAEEEFKKINTAYQVLSDPQKKQQYDQLIFSVLTQYFGQESVETARPAPPRRPHNPEHKVVTPLTRRHARYVYALFVGGLFFLAIFIWRFYFFMELFTAKTATEKAWGAYHAQEYGRALGLLSDVFKRAVEPPDASYLKGLIELRHFDRYEEAHRFIERAIHMTHLEEKPVPLHYHFERAHAAYYLRRYDDATRDLDTVLMHLPNHRHTQFLTAEILLYHEKRYAAAIAMYRLSAESDTFAHRATLGEAIARLQLKEYDRALALLESAHRKQPEDGVLYYYKGIHQLEAAADTMRACMLFEKARNRGVREAISQQYAHCQADSSWYFLLLKYPDLVSPK